MHRNRISAYKKLEIAESVVDGETYKSTGVRHGITTQSAHGYTREVLKGNI